MKKQLVTIMGLALLANSNFAQEELSTTLDDHRNALRVSLGFGASTYDEMEVNGANTKAEGNGFDMAMTQVRLEKNYSLFEVLPVSTSAVFSHSSGDESEFSSQLDYERSTFAIEQKAFLEVPMASTIFRPYVGAGVGYSRFAVELAFDDLRDRTEFMGYQVTTKVGFEVLSESNWSFDAYYALDTFNVDTVKVNSRLETGNTGDMKLRGSSVAVSIGYRL